MHRLFASLAMLALLCCCNVVLADPATRARPNVVILLSDDQAYTDYGFMGHPQITTPHLDQLAKESLTFTRGYVPTSLCRPSLMTLLTGRYAHDHLVTGNDPSPGTNRAEILQHIQRLKVLPAILREQGYKTLQTGKWWEGSPELGGFTSAMTHGDPKRGGRHGDEGLKIGRQGIQPIKDFLDSTGKEPFFIWYAPMLPHTPHNPPEEWIAKYRGKNNSVHVDRYHAMCSWWDHTCGEVLAELKNRKLEENTIVVYLCDNGWIQDPIAPKYAPRSKRSPNEGGVRTPIMLKWPGHITPRFDQTTLASSIDVVPTLLRALQLDVPKDLPGIDLVSLREGQNRPGNALFGEIFEHDIPDVTKAHPGLMYRWCIQDTWKLIVSADGKSVELYDLKSDPGETKNLAAAAPDRVQAMLTLLDRWWK
ncbi:sulfatase [Pirellula staleyi DSM 6068]|uniref:Sulfatase n=1 Tax=Pirellula staleyi (strain ATCC 27377 / DSM 6068 / ICPB 4128) TaxID=530564 RepID=D2QZB5_PIRSD|nr:sulfatase [Pirellula staleyi]ADB18307.1 sulfatase [Pirellula staleyi DSM 6068]